MELKINKLITLNFIIMASVFLCVFAVMKPVGFDVDSINYFEAVQNFSEIQIDEVSFEPIFQLISLFASLFDSKYRVLLFIYFVVTIFCNIYSINKLSDYPALSFFIYVSFFYVLHGIVQIRAGLAGAILLLLINDIANKNIKIFSVKVFVAFLTHYSSLIFVPLYFLNANELSKPKYILILLFSIIFCFLGDTALTLLSLFADQIPGAIGYKISRYALLLNEDVHSEISIFNLYNLMLTMFAFVLILISNKIKNPTDIIICKVFIISQSLFYFLSFLPVLATRASELLSVSLIIALTIPIKIFKRSLLVIFIIVIYVTVILYLNFFVKDLINLNLVRFYDLF